MKIIIMLGIIFVWNIQPYIIIIRLILITLVYSMFIYIRIGSFWNRYILMLVLISGVLVLFRYIARLIPNERFEYLKLLYIRIIIYLIFISKYIYLYIYKLDVRIYLLKMWKMSVNLYNIYLVLFLLRIIIMVVWLRSIDGGAVRNI